MFAARLIQIVAVSPPMLRAPSRSSTCRCRSVLRIACGAVGLFIVSQVHELVGSTSSRGQVGKLHARSRRRAAPTCGLQTTPFEKYTAAWGSELHDTAGAGHPDLVSHYGPWPGREQHLAARIPLN